jgi:hypothetical protein
MSDSRSNRVNECYQRAAECRERAEQASTPSLEASFRKLERTWLDLARSCELDESAYRLGEAARYFAARSNRAPEHWR